MAARASVELHTLLFFRARQRQRREKGDAEGGGGGEGGTIADARVVGVRANGVVVFVPRFGIEGPALLESGSENNGEESAPSSPSPPSKGWTLSADGCGATDPVSGKSVRVFDVVTVRISVRGGGEGGGGGGGGAESGAKGPSNGGAGGGGGGRERLVLELVDRSLLAAEDVATA